MLAVAYCLCLLGKNIHCARFCIILKSFRLRLMRQYAFTGVKFNVWIRLPHVACYREQEIVASSCSYITMLYHLHMTDNSDE